MIKRRIFQFNLGPVTSITGIVLRTGNGDPTVVALPSLNLDNENVATDVVEIRGALSSIPGLMVSKRLSVGASFDPVINSMIMVIDVISDFDQITITRDGSPNLAGYMILEEVASSDPFSLRASQSHALARALSSRG